MRKLALIILDGWGLGEKRENNAIHVAQTPFFDKLWNNFPHTQLQASGEFVGLPVGQIGGSEVGHLTIGAGRVIYQELPRINKSLSDKNLDIKNFVELIERGRLHTIHLIGLVSPGGVHSHQEHLLRLLEIMKANGCKSPWIHFISDGRDVGPKTAVASAQKLQNKIRELQFGQIATLSGRFYAMDRDKNLDRTKKAVDIISSPQQSSALPGCTEAIEASYHTGINDEFIEPVSVSSSYKGISPQDILFFTNFRNDRIKQLVNELHKNHPENPIYTMTQYDKSYTHPVLFEKQSIDNTLGEILSKLGKTQLRATESEKFPHVTYFFNGGVEVVFNGEIRSLAESNKVKHDEMPHMKAEEIHQNVRRQVERDNPDFILINFANPDMVGHTGVFKAVVAGVQKVDHELNLLCDYLSSKGYVICVTADHGNADIMYDIETGTPHTAHTLNPVPFIIYDIHNTKNQRLKLSTKEENGLHMIAGTVTDLMELGKKNDFADSLISS